MSKTPFQDVICTTNDDGSTTVTAICADGSEISRNIAKGEVVKIPGKNVPRGENFVDYDAMLPWFEGGDMPEGEPVPGLTA